MESAFLDVVLEWIVTWAPVWVGSLLVPGLILWAVIKLLEHEALLPSARELLSPSDALRNITFMLAYYVGLRLMVVIGLVAGLGYFTPLQIGFDASFTGWRLAIFEWRPCARCVVEWNAKLSILELSWLASQLAAMPFAWLTARGLVLTIPLPGGWPAKELILFIYGSIPILYIARIWFLPAWYL